ncbi:MAG: hypothetical protein J6B62_04745, partial [Bacteroidales bacterium]|nr:hypothetical protein [Bacteroidales bacterium]
MRMLSYTRAKELSQSSDDLRFRALIASGISDLYHKTYNDEEFISASIEEYELFRQTGDTLNYWISLGTLAVAYTDSRQWEKADSLFLEFFSFGVIDSLEMPIYQLAYATKFMLQPEPDPQRAVELIETTINDYGVELSAYNSGMYAFAYAMLGDFSLSDKYLAYIDTTDFPIGKYNWKYDIYKEKGDYENALYELENVFINQEDMIDGILRQSISRAQRDYFETKSSLLAK